LLAAAFYRRRICSTIFGSIHAQTTMTGTLRHRQLPAAARGRLLAWLAAIVLLLQLFAAVGHDHENQSRAQECVACAVQAQAHGAPPAPDLAPFVFRPVLLQLVAAMQVDGPTVVHASRLLPQPHAPPSSLLDS
jgi:hypothetical protein